jgi:hypothetical protein
VRNALEGAASPAKNLLSRLSDPLQTRLRLSAQSPVGLIDGRSSIIIALALSVWIARAQTTDCLGAKSLLVT